MSTTTEIAKVAKASKPAGKIGKVFAQRNAIMKFVASMNTGNIRDAKLTEKATEDHDIKGRKLSVRKYIMGSEELNNVISSVQAARNYFNSKSLPWADDGVRIVPSTSVIDLKVEMEERIRDIYDKVDKLIAALPAIIENDKETLKDTFNENDYPTAEELRAKFAARVEIRPIAVDFRVQGIEDSAQQIIQEQIENSIESALKETKHYQLEQLADAIRHLASKLVNNKSFKGGSIQNIVEAAEDIENLSLDNDENMKTLSEVIRKDFNSINADTIRENPTVRKQAADLANKRLQEINEMMKDFV